MTSVVRVTVLGLCLLLPARAFAQTFTPRALGQVAGKAHKLTDDTATSTSSVGLLSQADVSFDNKTMQVSLQAMDLFFSKNWRFYVRSTLPVPKETSEDGTSTAGQAAVIGDDVYAALFDPYGGVLNLSGGGFLNLKSLRTSGTGDDEHGVFLDARFGMKL